MKVEMMLERMTSPAMRRKPVPYRYNTNSQMRSVKLLKVTAGDQYIPRSLPEVHFQRSTVYFTEVKQP